MLKIWGRKTSSNVQKAMWAIGELKLPHERIDVGGAFGKTKDPFWFKKSLNFALPILARPYGKVLAHCAAGRNRGPSTAFAILRAFGLTRLEALAMIHLARPVTVGGIAYSKDADEAIKALGYE